MNGKPRTIVLVHGLWMTPQSWGGFKGYFEARGHRVLTPAWPGLNGDVAAMRRDPSGLNGVGHKEIADHFERIIRGLDEPPIIMGHSMGGLTTQILLDRGLGAAGVAIDAAPPHGILYLPFSAIRASFPVLKNPFNVGRTAALTFGEFRYAFANAGPEQDARALYEREAIPGPGRPLFQVAFSNLTPSSHTKVNFQNGNRAPLLLIAGGVDHIVPPSLTRAIFNKHKQSAAVTEYKEFPGRSHAIAAEAGWEEVAEYALTWAAGRNT
ncbi:MAG: alpha/beta hydrolase [Gemmatimonadales bacterium]|nr:alpha/beta hydrolase [Gemmatimonadales bacterium]